jgi:multidrug efflux pump subunit AcrA (membrane-fusion protein)
MSFTPEMKTPTDLPQHPATTPGVNGSPHLGSLSSPAPSANGHAARALPGSGRRRPGWVLPVIALGGFLVLGSGIAALDSTQQQEGRHDVILHPVKYEDLQLTVVEKGTLESAENKDVVCRVKAGAKGQGGYATSINWVIDDGSMVNEGQLLMILDDSALQDQLRAQKIVVDTALAAKLKAE